MTLRKRPTPQEVAEAWAADQTAQIRQLLPRLDWHDLWRDEEEEEYLLYPLIPARRLIALFSAAKTGKSLLMLEIAAALSTGRKVLGHDPGRRVRVLYIDFENDPRGDVRTRLQDMDYGPEALDHLDYLSFPSLPYLDSEQGAAALLAAVEAYRPELVVIDTISRAVFGEENDNNTWLNLYKHTGLALKQAKVAMIRLDHTGKDETKGQRGGSAKSGDVDAIWKLTTVVKDERYRLECTDSRFSLQAKELTLLRHDEPSLHHTVEDMGAGGGDREAKILKLIELADKDKLPAEGRDKFTAWLKKRSLKARKDISAEVVRRRKNRTSLLFAPEKPAPNPMGQVQNQTPAPGGGGRLGQVPSDGTETPSQEPENLPHFPGGRSGAGPTPEPAPSLSLYREGQGAGPGQNGKGRKHEFEPGILCQGGCGRAVGAAMALAGITTHPECASDA
jgi:hypothetical protein